MTKKAMFLLAAALPMGVLAQSVQPLALRAAEDYLQQARYPAWSQVLEAGAGDPLLGERTPTRQSRLGPEGQGPRLTVWSSTISALPGETVTLFAALTETGPKGGSLLEQAPAKGTAVTGARVTGHLTGLEGGSLGDITYQDDGKGADAVAGDGIYTGTFTLPRERAPALGTADSLMVQVAARLSEESVRTAETGFQFSNPAARLTGRFTDAVRDGNLVIGAEVEVLKPGRVYLAGTLADAGGVPFATAQAAEILEAGKHWLELRVYGLAFHDRGISGAVRLASVALSSTGSMPNALGPVLTGAYVTKAYSLAQFTQQPFNDPQLLESARRLQGSVPTVAPVLK